MSLTLYDFPLSANSYRVRLCLALFGLTYQKRLINLVAREHLAEAFKEINPLSQVPVINDDGLIIRESHAIVLYLAESYAPQWLPNDVIGRARVMQWMFFDASELHNGVGLARNFFAFGLGSDGEAPRARATRALAALDGALVASPWVIGDSPTLADLACYPFTTVLHEARIDQAQYPAIAAWRERIEHLPGYLAMDQ